MPTPSAQPNPRIVAVVWAASIVLGWLVSRPVGAVLLVFTIGNLRALVQRNAIFWERPRYALIFGGLAGTVGAVLTQTAAFLAFHSHIGPVALGVLGLFAVGYIGYGVPTNPLFQDRAEQLELATRGAAVSTYILVTIALLAWAFTHGWR